MRYDVLLRRILRPRAGRPTKPVVLFTRNTRLASGSRPQIPFLAIPLQRPQQYRYLTTQRNRWLVYEFKLALKYTLYFWIGGGILMFGYVAATMDAMERKYPTPPEWGFFTKMAYKTLMEAYDREESEITPNDWNRIGKYAKDALERFDDPNLEGAGLQEVDEGGLYIPGVGKTGYDLSNKSEPWRRGYYQVLMICGKAAEALEGTVLDKKTGHLFPADQVIGPSNPEPKPISPGSPPAPKEQDVEIFMASPETFYLRILTSKGFTSGQRMKAALAYANWLDFKGLSQTAGDMYEWALQLAQENTPPEHLPVDPKTLVLQSGPRQPSENLLTCLTEVALYRGRNGQVSTALPILVSILRARRSLPEPSGEQLGDDDHDDLFTPMGVLRAIKGIFVLPDYPPPPDDGQAVPERDAKELCEEAGLNLYIGEIMYASKNSPSNREEGVAWTREAVDVAEEQLHRIGVDTSDTAAKNKCKECLQTGLQNWSKMVERLVKEEEEKAQAAPPKSSWFNLWGDAASQQAENGRWAAEQKVVDERTRRAETALLQPRRSLIQSLFNA